MKPSTHYLYRTPGELLMLVAIALNVLVLAFMMVHLQALRSNVSVSFQIAETSQSRVQRPVFAMDGDSFKFGDQTVEGLEGFREALTGMNWETNAAVLQVGGNVNADQLSHALGALAGAGLNRVTVDMQGRSLPE